MYESVCEMKVVILCGGRGLRLNEYTETIPKSMVIVQGKPILYYICQHYKKYGHNDFIFCLGYKGEQIRTYFRNTDFRITFVDTGEKTNKTERVLKVRDLIKEKRFFLSYGDDICHINLKELFEFHNKNNGYATLTTVPLFSEFGIVTFDYLGNVESFIEKPMLPYWINGGYYIFEKEVLDYFEQNRYVDFEKSALPQLAQEKQLKAYKYQGFWKSVNTIKDVIELNETRKLLEK